MKEEEEDDELTLAAFARAASAAFIVSDNVVSIKQWNDFKRKEKSHSKKTFKDIKRHRRERRKRERTKERKLLFIIDF
jgi:hypothetical protein